MRRRRRRCRRRGHSRRRERGGRDGRFQCGGKKAWYDLTCRRAHTAAAPQRCAPPPGFISLLCGALGRARRSSFARTIGGKSWRQKPNSRLSHASIWLPQAREHLQPDVAISRLHSAFFLNLRDRAPGTRARTSVDAVRFEAAFVQPPLNFLHLIDRRDALAARELPVEPIVAADQIAEMAEGERVALRRIVGVHRAKILAD